MLRVSFLWEIKELRYGSLFCTSSIFSSFQVHRFLFVVGVKVTFYPKFACNMRSGKKKKKEKESSLLNLEFAMRLMLQGSQILTEVTDLPRNVVIFLLKKLVPVLGFLMTNTCNVSNVASILTSISTMQIIIFWVGSLNIFQASCNFVKLEPYVQIIRVMTINKV